MARVLYLTEGYRTHDVDFLEKLSQYHEVWFQPCVRETVQYETRPLPAGVNALTPLSPGSPPLGWVSWPSAVAKLRRVLATLKPNLLHAGPVQLGGFFGALIRYRPLVVMSWGSDLLLDAKRSRWQRLIARFTLRRAGAIVGDCEAVRQSVASLSSVDSDRLLIFPYGVDHSLFHSGASLLGLRQKLGWQDATIILSTRWFEPVYGPTVLLEAFAKALDRSPGLRLLMLGAGTLKPRVEAFIKQHGLGGCVHLAGQVPRTDMPGYFREADVYASASFRDSSSISLLEAMASGLPVVASDFVTNREWITPGLGGWLCPVGDMPAFAAALQEAAGASNRRQAMGLVNRTVTEQRADWNKNFDKLLRVYDSLLREPQAPERKHG